ncbi:MAG: hypothetical protein IJ222_04190 [Bacteroidales bacterium]|nr:hypothetical protein [Bacteroidales bacterium]
MKKMLKIPYGRLSEPQRLSCLNWAGEFPYKPGVEFRIGYDEGGIHLEYRVDEQSIRALQDVPGGYVYEDSCVEFFFQPSPDDPHYYNFEWNAIGTLYLAWRTGRQDPLNAPAEVLGMVKAEASCGSAPFAERPSEGPWTLKVFIPLEALWKSELPLKDGKPSLSGLRARANFYKCGDGLKVPHFVSWAPISTEKPDYHRPEFFGEVEFECN